MSFFNCQFVNFLHLERSLRFISLFLSKAIGQVMDVMAFLLKEISDHQVGRHESPWVISWSYFTAVGVFFKAPQFPS